MNSHFGDKMVLQLSYIYDGNPYTWQNVYNSETVLMILGVPLDYCTDYWKCQFTIYSWLCHS